MTSYDFYLQLSPTILRGLLRYLTVAAAQAMMYSHVALAVLGSLMIPVIVAETLKHCEFGPSVKIAAQ